MHICPDELMAFAAAVPFLGVLIQKLRLKFRK